MGDPQAWVLTGNTQGAFKNIAVWTLTQTHETGKVRWGSPGIETF